MSAEAAVDERVITAAGHLREMPVDRLVERIRDCEDVEQVRAYAEVERKLADQEDRPLRKDVLQAAENRLDDLEPGHPYHDVDVDRETIRRIKHVLQERATEAEPLTASEIAAAAHVSETHDNCPKTRQAIRALVLAEEVPVVGCNQGFFVARTEGEALHGAEHLRSRVRGTLDRAEALESMAAALPGGEGDG